jgi:hypothetical protein
MMPKKIKPRTQIDRMITQLPDVLALPVCPVCDTYMKLTGVGQGPQISTEWRCACSNGVRSVLREHYCFGGIPDNTPEQIEAMLKRIGVEPLHAGSMDHLLVTMAVFLRDLDNDLPPRKTQKRNPAHFSIDLIREFKKKYNDLMELDDGGKDDEE